MNIRNFPTSCAWLIAIAALAVPFFLPLPPVPTGETASKRPSTTVETHADRTPGSIIHEFHELGATIPMARDAQLLKQERDELLVTASTPHQTEDQLSSWKDYDKLRAEAEASDLATFEKEYDLHRLRVNDYLYRFNMCENDLRSYIQASSEQRSGTGKTKPAFRFEKQAQDNRRSLEEVENRLSDSPI